MLLNINENTLCSEKITTQNQQAISKWYELKIDIYEHQIPNQPNEYLEQKHFK